MDVEDEVLLPPGCRFEVDSVLPQGDLTIIVLIELPSKEWIIDISKNYVSCRPTVPWHVSEECAQDSGRRLRCWIVRDNSPFEACSNARRIGQ